MRLAYQLVAYGLRQVLDVGTGTVVAVLQRYLDDPAARLPKALQRANDDAWRVLELALQGRSGVLTRLKTLPARLIDPKERTALGDRIGAFLSTRPLALPDRAAAEAALAELRKARDRGLLGLDEGQALAETLPGAMDGLERYADPFALLAGAHRAVAALAEALEAQGCPRLAAVLRAQPRDNPPLLAAAFAWFLRRRVETDPELARGLQFEQLQVLAAGQAQGFAALDQAMRTLGADFVRLLGDLAKLRETADQTLGGVLDLQAEMTTLGTMHRQMHQAVLEQLQRIGAGRGVVSASLSYSIHSEVERRAVHALLAEVRRLPEAERERLPALLNGLGKLQLGIGEAGGAEASFTAAAQAARRIGVGAEAQAQAAYNAYRAALERRHWETAQAHLQRAVELDRGLAPCPPEKYQLQAILGAGGFGVALRCRNRYMGRDVVLKALYPEGLGRGAEQVFKEARILQEIRHPALIRIHNADYTDPAARRGPYLEMEWFPGKNLADHLQAQGNLDLDQARALFPPIVEAMRAVHAKGLLHRDLSPDNILIKPKRGGWDLRIIDFGLAHRYTAAPALGTRSVVGESLTGKLDYAPPEQRLGGECGPWSDVYAFGKLVCKALFGTVSPRRRHWNGLPEGLAQLLEDCIDDDIQHRPADFGVVAERLTALETEAVEVPKLAPKPKPTPRPAAAVVSSPAKTDPGEQVSGGRRTPRRRLRSSPKDLSKEQAEAMFKQRGFFASDWNPGGRFANDFADNGDGTVTDRATGLMWQKGGSSNTMPYKKVKAYIAGLNREGYAGHSDWRLPTLEEGASLLAPTNHNHRYIAPLFDVEQWAIWTSDTKAGWLSKLMGSAAACWYVFFGDGSVDWHDHGDGYCVRVCRAVGQ